ncbi:MAG: tRNA guanosine(34) transglycosylase Tgt [Hyphomicrobiales bacterium]|jgi:queuine tRNA-ribosyltransferase|nr:tRNA guanosine(34) transglycosylase Tgt [Hyphomicrobiales bacterium]
MTFEIKKTDGKARNGILKLPNGMVETPVFMPVGTQGTVKAMFTEKLEEIGFKIILANTYHMFLRPGCEVLDGFGGLNNFMKWDKPILTDSGGFQIMSLSKLTKIHNDGVHFQSHIDGKKFYLTPKLSMEIQNSIGSDIQMVLDQCIEYDTDITLVKNAMSLSLKWAELSKKSFFKKNKRKLFGIVQGGVNPDLRKFSAEETIKIGFDGYAIGGLAVGEGQKLMLQTLDYTVPLLPIDKPRYLMGVGTPQDLLEAVRRGVDMFDCVMPTRAGRHGLAYTSNGKINIRNSKYSKDHSPINSNSLCPVTSKYSRAYLHHLFKSKEILGSMILTYINLQYYDDLMIQLRKAIHDQKLDETMNQIYEKWDKKENI